MSEANAKVHAMKLVLFLSLFSVTSAFACDTSSDIATLSRFENVDVCRTQNGFVLEMMYDWRQSGVAYNIVIGENDGSKRSMLETTLPHNGDCACAKSLVGGKSADQKSVTLQSIELDE